MYDGPQKNTIDRPLLSKILYHLDTLVPHDTKVCLIGGSALTLLGVREHGSEDVDIICLNHDGRFQGTVHHINQAISDGKIYIDVTDKGVVKQHYPVGRSALVQNFGMNLPSANLPSDFDRKAHHIRKIEWVFPEGGGAQDGTHPQVIQAHETLHPCAHRHLLH